MRILLLDDNPQDRFLAKRELQREFPDAEIVEIFDPAQFATQITAGNYDLVVTEYQMLWMDGMAVLNEVKSRDPFCPVVMFTATATQETPVAAMKAGLDDYVIKSPAHFVRLPIAAATSIERANVRRRESELRAERERLVVQLQEANRLKDEFLATVSHELRTPLSAILGWTRIFRYGSTVDPQKFEKGLDSLERNADKLVRLVTDLLDFSRLALGGMQFDIGKFDVAKTVEQSVDGIRPAAASRQTTVKTDLAPSAFIEGDEDRIRRVIDSLLSNAVKFTPEGGQISVRCHPAGAYVEIEVVDTGVGIKSDFLSHVFERFRQGDGSTTRPYSGLGLGLALAKEIVQMHHGSIRVESEGPGQGSKFTVQLPTSIQRHVTA